ncbi:protein RALF-like 22 [Cocos nucifera]|uniref:Protein RALF-like 22 n=1 Tax=Cocos nucifera TaxID=13894 RepID=A0A8K0IAD6_COCNU|nr:protein RALF-like 22 [Cocos nucifera]
MSLRLVFLLFILAIADSSSLGDEVSTAELDLSNFSGSDAELENSRTLGGERVEEEEEEMGWMEAEVGRRELVAYRGRFISYGALSRNRVPCGRRGNSYYNCQQHQRANPYRRGCSIITQCARIFH